MKTQDAEKKAAALAERFGAEITTAITSEGVLEATVPPARVPEVLSLVRQDPAFDYHQLHDLTAVDYPKDNQIMVLYRLMNLDRGDMTVVKTRLDRAKPQVASATPIWPAANWLEREVYDLFGVVFVGHPNLTRILMWDEFQGHPLRKDFDQYDQFAPGGEPR